MYFKSYIHKGVAAVDRCYREAIESRTQYGDIYEYLEALAELLAEAYLQEDPAAFTEFSNWMPGYATAVKADIFDQNFGLNDMRRVVARSHGFKKWKHVDKKGDREFDETFESAVDAIQTGDIEKLRSMLDEHPDLVNQKSPLGHRARLLHYCATNGVETYHQKLPLNMPAIAALLIERGAAKETTAKCYGGKHTAYEMAATSAHPVAAGIQKELLKVLEV